MFIKCRCFKAGSAGKSFCTETGSSEPPQLSSSYTPGSLYAIAEFYCSEFVSLLFLVEKDNAVMCRGARRAEQKTLWRVGERGKKSLSQVHLCAFVHVLEPATLCPLPPRKAELGDGGGALQPALCWLPLTREREITVLAGTPRQAVPAQLASPACHPPGEGMDAASRPWHHSYTEQLQREPWAFLGAIQPWLSLH